MRSDVKRRAKKSVAGKHPDWIVCESARVARSAKVRSRATAFLILADVFLRHHFFSRGARNMDVLIIEDDAGRRVSVADHLKKCRHRVSISSSIREAREMLEFVECKADGPDAVIISEGLLPRGGQAFREELAERFPAANWVPLPHDRSVVWLSDWLEKVSGMPSRHAKHFPGFKVAAAKGRTGQGPAPRLDVLLIEADDRRRQVTSEFLSRHGDRVKACRSIAEATEALAAPAWRGKGPHAIVSRVGLSDGCGINFFLAAKKRFPRTRWIVSTALPGATVTLPSAEEHRTPLH
jgi:DNA-binding NarL/FixJ family response regulator